MSQQYRYPSSAEVSVNISSEGATGSPVPADALQVGGKDSSGNLRALSVSTTGVLNVAATALPLPSGAATEATLAAMSAKLPASLGIKLAAGSLSIVLASDGILPLPSGAATEAKQDTGNTSLASIDSKIVACNTGAVVVSSSALPSGAATEGTLATLNGKVTACNTGAVVVSSSALPSGAATDTVATANGVLVGAVNETAPASDTASSGLNGRLQRIAQRLTSMIAQLPATLGQKAMAASLAVTIASDQSALSVTPTAASTATTSSVADQDTNINLLASNSSRKGAMVFNESTAVLYLKLGTTASLTSYTVQIQSNGYYELPGPIVYTGNIDGIWASNASGNARITELT